MDGNHGDEVPFGKDSSGEDGASVALPTGLSSTELSGTGSSGGVITARGTGDGLVLRIDGRVDGLQLRAVLREFMRSRRSFLTGNEVALEWIGQQPEGAIVDSLGCVLEDEFGISVSSSRLRETGAVSERAKGTDVKTLADGIEHGPIIQRSSSSRGQASRGDGVGTQGLSSRARGASLFGGLEYLPTEDAAAGAHQQTRAPTGRGFDPSQAMWDDPDARILYTTLRSGQKIESEHSVVICGDINSGAEVVAGGDIVVLGTLRGVAHAGAYDETGGGRFIFALNLQPTQLRIGSTISRGSSVAPGSSRNSQERSSSSSSEPVAEIARVDGAMIVVEPYQARTAMVRR